MHCYYGDESFTYAYHNIIFVNIINNCFSFGFMESVKNCFGSKMRMTKQDRYKSNDAEMQKKIQESHGASHILVGFAFNRLNKSESIVH